MNTSKIKSLLTQARQEIKNAPRRTTELWVGLNLALLSSAASATPKLDFTGTTTLLTDFVKFIAGPFGKAAVIISIVAAFVTWVFAPREGIFGPVLRVVVAGIAVMNAAIWVSSLGAGGGSITLT
jgi:type IV secretory pathway VirB2 component (pilin)